MEKGFSKETEAYRQEFLNEVQTIISDYRQKVKKITRSLEEERLSDLQRKLKEL